MQKFKSLNPSGLLNLFKCALIGIVSTLVGTLTLAVVLKFTNLNSNIISHINNIIKIFSVFIMVICIKRNNEEKLMVKVLFSGAIYTFLSFIIFSILNGAFVWNMSFIYDLIFSIIASAISFVIISILKNKTM